MVSSLPPSDGTQKAPAPSPIYHYPFAAAPDIIRANQKDIYFQGVLHEQLSSIIRRLYGARVAHNYDSEARTFTELLYLGLTTFIGNRTLGEEYCDILHLSDDTRQLPAIGRRAGYILSAVLLPYTLTRLLPALRARVRLKLEANLRRRQQLRAASKDDAKSFPTRFQSYLLTHLSTITSPSPIYALTLTIFYFTGSYYHLSKRLFGLRYIFTKRTPPSEQRVGYEVLGVLLVLQMAVQGWLHLHSTFRSPEPSAIADAGSFVAGGSAIVDGGVEVGTGGRSYTGNNDLLLEATPAHHDVKKRIETTTHTPILNPEKPRYDLKDSKMMGWIQGRQQRKCTLCLEEMRDPSATTCGHVFCWTCIADWIREKPECPLCRQHVMAQHVLALRG